jgi:hypothetical protein
VHARGPGSSRREGLVPNSWHRLQGDLRSNCFLFTLDQASRKRRAIEDGPWMFGKDLIVVVEFYGKKRLKDIRFERIPICLRESGMQLLEKQDHNRTTLNVASLNNRKNQR